MTATKDITESVEDATVASPGKPSPWLRALGVVCDVLLMLAALLIGWWAWDGAGAVRRQHPAWQVASGSAGSAGLVLNMAQHQPWRLGNQPLSHDAELATAVGPSPSPARIALDERVLFAQVARALEILEREGVRSATINLTE